MFRWRALEIDEALKQEIGVLPVAEANDGFTPDKLFLDLAKRTQKPKVVFQKERRKESDWQYQHLLATYFEAESAFTRSGLVLGGNAADQRKLLEEKRGQVRNALQALSIWTCPHIIPHPYLVYAAFRSNWMGLFPPNVE